MHVLGIIPARGGSKRIPGKNLRTLGGKPLVARAIETALAARCLDRVVVSSDDDEILKVARSYGSRLALRRPAGLAADRSPAIDYVRHALEETKREMPIRFDAVAIVQPTSPLTLPGDVDATLRMLERTGAESAASVVKLDHALQPAKLKRLVDDRLVAYLEDERGRLAAHELPELYVRNGAVYASRRDLIQRGQIVGEDCRGYVMPRERSIDINEEIDLLFAEFLLERFAARKAA